MHHRLLFAVVLAGAVAACSDPDGGTPGGVAGTASIGGSGGSVAGTGGSTSGAGGAGGSAGGSTGGLGGGGTGGSGGSGGMINNMPTLLSETGLFTDMANQTLAPGVYAYDVAYALWSDGADKKRWVYMPPGGKIQTDSTVRGMEYWTYPTGFKLWKEFRRDGKLIETRLLQKKSEGLTDWYMVSFKWKDDHSDAVALVEGEPNSMGTEHDIPSQKACGDCHGSMYDNVLGFSALQLSHSKPGSMTIDQASQLGWFNQPPVAGGYKLQGTEVETNALGYMHANCGICHNSFSKLYSAKSSLDLWTRLDQLSVPQTRAYLSMVCDQWPGPGGKTSPISSCEAGHATGAAMDIKDISKMKRIVPKDAANSGVHDLMSLRVAGATADSIQMPPIATEIKDPTGLKAVEDWINSLPTQ